MSTPLKPPNRDGLGLVDGVGTPVARDMGPRLTRWARSAAAALATLPGICLVSMVVALIAVGAPRLSWSFLFERPEAGGTEGGIGPVLISTLVVVGIAVAVSTPAAVGAATVIAKMSGTSERGRRLTEVTTDVLAAVPSVIIGIVGNALFVHALGLGYSLLSGGLTLAFVVLPTMTRTIAAGLRSLPRELYLAGLVTGLSPARFVVQVVAPTAKPIVVFGFVVGLARGTAETAALLFTSGYVDRLPGSVLDPGRVLSVHIYELAVNVPQGRPTAYATGLVLIALLGAFGVAGRVAGRHGDPSNASRKDATAVMGGAG